MAATRRIPHTRGGEPFYIPLAQGSHDVFPTRVGVNRRPRCRPCAQPSVFPTRVGVNRFIRHVKKTPCRIPHTRGGEPESPPPELRLYWVFPTRVGVNRSRGAGPGRRPSIPHTRGGEPAGCQEISERSRVFPTRVGVNRLPLGRTGYWLCVFPTRVGVNRNDTGTYGVSSVYSPHAWG